MKRVFVLNGPWTRKLIGEFVDFLKNQNLENAVIPSGCSVEVVDLPDSFEDNVKKSREATLAFDLDYAKTYAKLASSHSISADRNSNKAVWLSSLSVFFSCLALLKAFGVF